jgi:hypothetical protein
MRTDTQRFRAPAGINQEIGHAETRGRRKRASESATTTEEAPASAPRVSRKGKMSARANAAATPTSGSPSPASTKRSVTRKRAAGGSEPCDRRHPEAERSLPHPTNRPVLNPERVNPMFPPDFEPKMPAGVTELVLSLASFVSADDVGMDRKEFLRLVAGRILEDLGL